MNESYFDGPLLVSRLALIISCAKILTIDGLDNFQRSSKLLALQHFVKALLKAKGSAAVLGLVSDITAVRLHAPSFCRVFELKLENWKRDFDAPVEVSRHPVRGREPKGWTSSIMKIEDSRVLEVSIYDGDHPYIL